MKKLVLTVVFLPMLCYSQDSSQYLYLIKNFDPNSSLANYTWLYKGQPLGLISNHVNFPFDEKGKICRLVDINLDTITVIRVNAYRDTVIVTRGNPYLSGQRINSSWEYVGKISRHKGFVTTQYRKILEADTFAVALDGVRCLRSYRKQNQRGSAIGIAAFLVPPYLAYILIGNIYPARDYYLKDWKPTYHKLFRNPRFPILDFPKVEPEL